MWDTVPLRQCSTALTSNHRHCQHIPPYSFHAPSVARGWILTELLRIRRNSSTELARLNASLKFYKRLGKRGYTANFLSSVFKYESARQGKVAQAARRDRQFLVLPFDTRPAVDKRISCGQPGMKSAF